MFVDACAIIAVLSDEPEAERVSRALAGAKKRITSPVAVLEAVLGLARPDKFNLSVEAVETLVLEFLDERGVDIRDLPPARRATALSLSAAHRYRSGRRGLNLGDCLHYACAKYYRVPILATSDEFRETDLETVP
ncbi:MAG TPA: type II toxin-antitoxin system VapC family toxin [Bosea sp. (in: a-proteobacteria)]|jgi:ribonuclease VapC|nr:type II toxin-antitoxin system VapC family toxin [Bosea sp. (in: a-proteobacteria)]